MVRLGRSRRCAHTGCAALLVFITSVLLSIASAITSPQSSSPRDSSDFYEGLDVDTVDDADEVIGSDGTLQETSPDIHNILELIEDGRIYPVLTKDESQYTPFTSVSKDEDFSVTPEITDTFDQDGSKTQFSDFEESEKTRRKRDGSQHQGIDVKSKVFDEIVRQDIGLNDMKSNNLEEAPITTLTETVPNKKTEKENALFKIAKTLVTAKHLFRRNTIIPGQDKTLTAATKSDSVTRTDNVAKRETTKVLNKQDLGSNRVSLNNSTKKHNNIDKVVEIIKRHSAHPVLAGDNNERIKRDASKENKTAKEPVKTKEKRIKTGDTILNIKGAVKDSIGDASPGRSSGASVLDAVVIHPSQYLRDAPAQADNDTEHTTREATTSTAGSPGSVGGRRLLAEHRSRVRLHCDLPANITVQEWVKDGEPQIIAPGAGFDRPVWWADGTGGAAIVGRAGRGEAGAWRCAGYNEAGEKVLGDPLHLTVYEESRQPYMELDGRRLDAGNTWVPVREGVILEVLCISEGGVPPPELTWRLVGAPGPNGPTELRRHLRAFPTNYTQPGLASTIAKVTITRALHNASLECDATQPRPEPKHPHTGTARLLVHVTFPPSFVISRWPGFGVALWTGARAALRCDVDSNPPARAWWAREPDAPTTPPPVAPDAPHSATLGWAALALADAGWYRCRARWGDQEYSSIGYYLSVRPASEQPPSSSESPPSVQNVEVPLGGTVQVHCPKGTVGCWSRRVLGLNGTEMWTPAGSARAHGVLGIRGALHQEGGEYRCVGARAEDEHRLRELKRISLSVIGSPTATALSTSALPSGGWLLSCAVCGRGERVRWLLSDSGAVVRPGEVTPHARASPLEPDAAAPSCALAQLEVAGGAEAWCVAAGAAGGAVAVFPARAAHPPPRALATAAARRSLPAAALLLLLAVCNVT